MSTQLYAVPRSANKVTLTFGFSYQRALPRNAFQNYTSTSTWHAVDELISCWSRSKPLAFFGIVASLFGLNVF